MDAETGLVGGLPVGRHLAIDERGVGLRATWRLDRGFVNISLWTGDSCVETFHLTPAASAELIGFLARGLADATAVATMATVSPVGSRSPVAGQRLSAMFITRKRAMQRRIAGALTAAASRINQT